MLQHPRLWLIALLALLLALTGCGAAATGSDAAGSAESAESGETASADLFTGNCTPSGPLRLYNWPIYLDPEVMEDFGQRYGIRVTLDEYTSNEEMMAKLRAGGSGYDLVFPSDYAVAIMANEGLLAEIDHSNIPNMEHLNPDLMGLYYDEGNKFSIPYQWGTIGLAYNAKYFDTAPTSWAYFFEAEKAEALEGYFTMLNNEREAIGTALAYLGYSYNDTNPDHVAEAADLLMAQREFSTFNGYSSADQPDALAGEEVIAGQAWSGLTARAMGENDTIKYIIPEEGGVIWQDNFAIPADASNKCTAELFINYALEPDVAAAILKFSHFSSPVPAAYERLGEMKALLEAVVPDQEQLERLEWIEPHGETTIFSDTWTEIKSN